MTRIRFLSAWCLAPLASACLANAASANDYVDVGCTDGCSKCGATVCSCSDNSFCEQVYLFPQKDCGFNLRGWVDAGFIWNTSDPVIPSWDMKA